MAIFKAVGPKTDHPRGDVPAVGRLTIAQDTLRAIHVEQGLHPRMPEINIFPQVGPFLPKYRIFFQRFFLWVLY